MEFDNFMCTYIVPGITLILLFGNIYKNYNIFHNIHGKKVNYCNKYNTFVKILNNIKKANNKRINVHNSIHKPQNNDELYKYSCDLYEQLDKYKEYKRCHICNNSTNKIYLLDIINGKAIIECANCLDKKNNSGNLLYNSKKDLIPLNYLCLPHLCKNKPTE